MVITDLQSMTKPNFLGYQQFSTLPSDRSGVMILVKANIQAQAVECYGHSQLTIEITRNQFQLPIPYGSPLVQGGEVESEQEKVILMGVNIVSHTEWKSFKTFLKKIEEYYLNPRLIVCGNWHKHSEEIIKKSKRLNIQNLSAFKNSSGKSN